MRRNRNASIVATLGPASSRREIVEAPFSAGADVFRLDFSHGTHEDHARRLEIVRAVERDAGRPIGVLLDLQGPKLRIGTFRNGPVRFEAGAMLRLDLDPTPGDARACHCRIPRCSPPSQRGRSSSSTTGASACACSADARVAEMGADGRGRAAGSQRRNIRLVCYL